MINTKTICLGALMLKDCTGYDIRKMCEEGELKLVNYISFGSIYPTLSSLEKSGFATCKKQKQKGKPDKKIYSITEAGKKEFTKSISKDDLAEDRYRSEYLFALLFAQEISPKEAENILDTYTKYIKEDKCFNRQDLYNKPGTKFLNGFGKTVHNAMIKYIEENKSVFLQEIALYQEGKNEQL